MCVPLCSGGTSVEEGDKGGGKDKISLFWEIKNGVPFGHPVSTKLMKKTVLLFNQFGLCAIAELYYIHTCG